MHRKCYTGKCYTGKWYTACIIQVRKLTLCSMQRMSHTGYENVFFGKYFGNVWEMFGKCLGNVWEMLGKC